MKGLLSNLCKILLIITVITSVNISFALKTDKNQETKLSSDSGNFNDVDQEYILTGNVLITKGSIIVKGGKAVVIVDPEGYLNKLLSKVKQQIQHFSPNSLINLILNL